MLAREVNHLATGRPEADSESGRTAVIGMVIRQGQWISDRPSLCGGQSESEAVDGARTSELQQLRSLSLEADAISVQQPAVAEWTVKGDRIGPASTISSIENDCSMRLLITLNIECQTPESSEHYLSDNHWRPLKVANYREDSRSDGGGFGVGVGQVIDVFHASHGDVRVNLRGGKA